ncbi:uncharacterized protein LOC124277082 [Haliotis rubra]|uniref:uncharacterized protein LOC124277082 n=1 Tax=Haliotis rubra TaxID=36100 RepID=UPI001EE587AE|nr:uncharacterized protein LOC124277082 [Haliotis rubra]
MTWSPWTRPSHLEVTQRRQMIEALTPQHRKWERIPFATPPLWKDRRRAELETASQLEKQKATFNQGDKQRGGLSCSPTEGANPKLKISVPAQDGGTLIYVDCSNAKVRDWYYRQNVDTEKAFVSIWTFGNIFDGFKPPIINGETGDALWDLTAKLIERYGCLLYKIYKGCLVIEFLHETEEGRNKMINEQDTVKQMFQDFLESVKPNAPVCTLEVKEKETPTFSGKPDTASKYTGQNVSSTSTPSSAQARSPELEEELMSELDSFYLERMFYPVPVPVPLSQVDLLDCQVCLGVHHDCEDDLSTLENVFFIHWNPDLASHYKFQFSKILTAFRNSHGGVLIVHGFNTSQSGDFHESIKRIFGSILKQDVDPCEVFKTQKIRNNKYMFRIDVEPSNMFVTLDYKTKFPSLSEDKFGNASNEKVRHLLFSSRTTESANPALRGISSQHQNLGALRLYCHKGYAVPPLEHELLHSLVGDMTGLSVPEHISALSKKKSGGTMYVVMPKLKFDEIPLDLQKRMKDHLMQALINKLLFQTNKHSKVSLQDFGVFDIASSKDTETGGCVIEIAVGHVNGCVFYDPEGPESYKIVGNRLVRLPFEKWIEEAFE